LRHSNESGFSLMEIMVAVVVLSIAVFFLSQMLVSGRINVEMEGERRMALKLAEHKIEELKYAGYGSSGIDVDWTSVNLDVGTHPDDGTVLIDGRGTADTGDDLIGTMTWAVRDTTWDDGTVTTECKIVRVEVEWTVNWPRDRVGLVTMVGR